MSTFDDVKRALGAKASSGQWIARCPAHDDGRPSLRLDERDGRWLFRCYAGCSFDDIRAALTAKGIEFPEGRAGLHPEQVWFVNHPDGTPAAQKVRYIRDGEKSYYWRGPNGEKGKLADWGFSGAAALPLYRIDQIGDADTVWITEGEKAADAAARLGLAAVGTVTGANGLPCDQSLLALKGRRVVLWPDHDPVGEQHMRRVKEALERLGARDVLWFATQGAPVGADAADYPRDAPNPATRLPKPVAGRVRPLAAFLKEALRDLDNFAEGNFADRVSTGISVLDLKLDGGLKGGEVTLLGAPTGGGKTTIAQQIAACAAKPGPNRRHGSVLFVTPEMRGAALAEREIIRSSGVRKWDRKGAKRDGAAAAHAHAFARLAAENLPVFLIDSSDVTMQEVEAEAEKLPDLALVVIDYAQQVASEEESRPRYLQVGDIGRRSVALAERLNVPVIVCSQVNRIKDKRGDVSYTFRETAILEQKAHNVLIFDPKHKDAEPFNPHDAEGRPGVAILECLKNRSGYAFAPLRVSYNPALYLVEDEDVAGEAAWQPDRRQPERE